MSACGLLSHVPEVCTPESFNKLLIEGRLDELRELEERCYVRAEHINSLVECFEYIADLLENVVKGLVHGG